MITKVGDRKEMCLGCTCGASYLYVSRRSRSLEGQTDQERMGRECKLDLFCHF